ncbi:TIGR01777 family oxidoreductase [Pontibacterium granulatum]|uniref:TIGR01777 family oxidoreductase n=1 Tax=Pontibacterium granulatum TaxID=2036029 RepID=UPI00249AB80B|nr:TIGR01777 family oxidoreductase [Pontibacterium granulatum]MDI3323496.1 TIGR01777 family oxidoreductase [Pontibacterium granulatum]
MKVLITGGTGFIGQAYIKWRQPHGVNFTCITRNPDRAKKILGPDVRTVSSLMEVDDEAFDAVINLCGEPIADRRWSDKRKNLLRYSRLTMTHALVDWMAMSEKKPSVFISGSAIGYYGTHPGDDLLVEASAVRQGFTHSLCADWEEEAMRAAELGVRVCLIRTGVVLGEGGALKKMLPPFKMGVGGPIGTGRQWMSWIHLEDELRAIDFLLRHQTLQGAFNLTAPEARRNAEFAQALGRSLKRPAKLPLPPFVVELMLGEGAELLLEGQRVYPQRLMQAGFEFKYPELDQALAQIFQ